MQISRRGWPLALLTLAIAASAPGASPNTQTPVPLAQASAVPTPTPQPSPAATPVAPATPVPAAVAQPGSPLAGAPVTPVVPELAAPEGVSGLAVSSDPVPPEEIADPLSLTAQSPSVDLHSVDDAVLTRMSLGLSNQAEAVWYDHDQDQALSAPSGDAWQVSASDLFSELARRAEGGDKDARQALALARLRGDSRADTAKAPAAAAALSPSAR